MLNMNIDWYEKMTRAEALDRYDWGYGLDGDSTVFRSETGEHVVMVGKEEDGGWCCEIEGDDTVDGEYGEHWNMVASAYGADTPERAIEAAVVDMVGSLDMLRREGNCEDAVNVLAHAGYQFAYGPTPLMEMDFELMDGLFAAAKAYVERNSRFAGFEWEDVW